MLHKDLLQLVFLEFEDGHDMINFSELNRKCHQIFHQHIKIEDNINNKIMKNIHGQKHGIYREWYSNGQLRYEHNYVHDLKHGICYGWYPNGQLKYEDNYFHGQKHGICRRWYPNGQLGHEYIITFMVKKLKNKTPGNPFFVSPNQLNEPQRSSAISLS